MIPVTFEEMVQNPNRFYFFEAFDGSKHHGFVERVSGKMVKLAVRSVGQDHPLKTYDRATYHRNQVYVDKNIIDSGRVRVFQDTSDKINNNPNHRGPRMVEEGRKDIDRRLKKAFSIRDKRRLRKETRRQGRNPRRGVDLEALAVTGSLDPHFAYGKGGRSRRRRW
jgi:hypothetical protein